MAETSNSRVRVVAVVVGAFLACIVAANYATQHFGLVQGVGGMVTAGTYLAGATFTLRDAVHETWGRWHVIALIIVGAALSWFVAPVFAVASGAAFLVSELADLAVYEPLRKRQWETAVVASGVVGSIVDTFVFLRLAHLPTSMWVSQVATKTAVTVVMLVVIRALLRNRKHGEGA